MMRLTILVCGTVKNLFDKVLSGITIRVVSNKEVYFIDQIFVSEILVKSIR